MATGYGTTTNEARANIIGQIEQLQSRMRADIRSGKMEGDINSINNSVYGPQLQNLERQLRSTGTLGEIGTGIVSSVMGLATGIPDLALMGVNYARNKMFTPSLSDLVTGRTQPDQLKGFHQMGMEAVGLASSPTSAQAAPAFYGPDVALGVYGVASLLKSGVSGLVNWKKNKSLEEFTKTLPPEEANRFSQFMMSGQGSSDPTIAAVLQKLKGNPKYAELFSTLEKGATEAAVKGMAPRPSRQSPEEATASAVTAVDKKFESLRKARSDAGNVSFTKAREAGEDLNIVSADKTLSNIRSLKERYIQKATPSSEQAVKFLQSLEDRLAPTGAGGASKKLNISETQGLLEEFGKNATQGNSLIKDLALSDERIISSAIFGGLKTDLEMLSKTGTTAERKAAGYLMSAREQTKVASEAYNKLAVQGMPKALEGKSISELSPEDLYKTYEGLTPTQRYTFRSIVSPNNKEALQALDKQVFDSFVLKSKTTLPDGTVGTDLGELSKKWATMPESEKDALVQALGVNKNEFTGRMKDALIFTRKMTVAGLKEEAPLIQSGTQRDFAAAVGSVAGYQPAKMAELSIDAMNAIVKKTKLSDDVLMKVLLTPEGAGFLKNASLSPNSAKTLEALTTVENMATPTWKNPLFISAVTSSVSQTDITKPTTAEAPPPISMGVFDEAPPPSEFPAISSGVFDEAPKAKGSFGGFASTDAEKDRSSILQQEMRDAQIRAQTSTTPDERSRAEADIAALTRELGIK